MLKEKKVDVGLGNVGNDNSINAHNVVSIQNRSVGNLIKIYLNSQIKNTRTAYEYNYRQFFSYMRGKDLEEITEQDLIVRKSEVMEFKSFLREKDYGEGSISQKLNSLRSLYRYLQGEELSVNLNPEVFSFKDGKHKVRERDILTSDEMWEMIELVKNERKGLLKSLFLEFAWKTAYRKDALLNIKWSDFKWNGEVYVVEVWDKGKLHRKSIDKEFYDRLVSGIGMNSNDDKVFKLDSKTPNAMISRLVDKLGIKDRYIVFHSIKKSSINEVKQMTNGDLDAMEHQGNHSKATSLKYYSVSKDDPSRYPCLFIGKEVDLSKLENLSKEELLDLIKRSGKITQMKILELLGG